MLKELKSMKGTGDGKAQKNPEEYEKQRCGKKC